MMISLATFLERHASRRAAALSVAPQGPEAAAELLIAAWGLHPTASVALAAALSESSARAPSPSAANLLRPAIELPPLPERALDLRFRDHLCRRATPLALDGPQEALAWAVAALLGLAQDQADLTVSAWAERRYADHPSDGETRKILASYARGEAWDLLRPAHRLSWATCQGVFRAAMRARGLPQEVQAGALERLEESWPYLLLIGAEDGPAAMPEVLARAVETLGEAGPLAPLAPLLDQEAWERLACELTLGRWRGPLSRLYREPRGRTARAAAVAHAWRQDSTRFARDLRAVLLLRLTRLWTRAPELGVPVSSWRRLEVGQARGRARLRAAVSQRPEALVGALLRAPAPYARLMTALRRYALALFWAEAEHNFPGSSCAAPRPPAPPLPGLSDLLPDAELLGSLRAWILLVILRGDGPLLAAWRDHRIGRTGGTWDRRVHELPPSLSAQSVGAHRLARLSLALMARPELLTSSGAPGDELLPYLARVAILPRDHRATLRKIRAILRDAAVPGREPEPGGGSPGMVDEARRWSPGSDDEQGGAR